MKNAHLYSVTETVAIFEAKLKWEIPKLVDVNETTRFDDSLKRKTEEIADADGEQPADKKVKMEIKEEIKEEIRGETKEVTKDETKEETKAEGSKTKTGKTPIGITSSNKN